MDSKNLCVKESENLSHIVLNISILWIEISSHVHSLGYIKYIDVSGMLWFFFSIEVNCGCVLTRLLYFLC